MNHGPFAMPGMSPHGNERIDVTSPASLRHWSTQLRMTEIRLVEVVAIVGTMVNAVECYITRRGYRP